MSLTKHSIIDTEGVTTVCAVSIVLTRSMADLSLRIYPWHYSLFLTIFEAGFSMNKKNFFLNMGSILGFTFVGTFFSVFVVGYGLYALSRLHVISLGLVECLLFG